MPNATAILRKLPKYQDKEIILEPEQDVDDIISGMRKWHNKFKKDYDCIAPDFIAQSESGTLKRIFNFLHNNTFYDAESIEDQTVRSPAAIIETGNNIGIDCKNYSLFIGGVIDAINRTGTFKIPFVYRFASYDLFDKVPKHVFIVAYPGSDAETWIDPCFESFDDQRKQPIYFIDKNFSKMALRGLMGTDANVNGWLSDTFAGSKRREQLKELLPQIAPYCFYLYITRTEFGTAPVLGKRAVLSFPMPPIVKDKQIKCWESLYDFGDQANVNVGTEVFPQVRKYLADFLGEDPTDWWLKILQSNQVSIGGTGFQDALDDPFGFAVDTVKSLFGGLFKDLAPSYPIEQWIPDPSDWAGTNVQPFNHAPLKKPAPGGGSGSGGSGSGSNDDQKSGIKDLLVPAALIFAATKIL